MTDEPEVYEAHKLLFDYCNARFLKKYTSLVSGTPSLDPSIQRSLSTALYMGLRGSIAQIVAADLKLFEPSRLLYHEFNDEALPEKLKRLVANPTDRQALLDTTHEGTEPELKHEDAYKQYCRRILTRPSPPLIWWKRILNWFNPAPPQGIAALFMRQPNAQWLLETITTNFINNLDLCLKRVRADRKAIERCFLDGQKIQQISNVTVSDSDPHKGGKQVIFLTFKTTQGETKVVYKPSDVEIDYRLVGKNTPHLVAFLNEQKSTGYPQAPYESLYEVADNLFASQNENAAHIEALKKGPKSSLAYTQSYERMLGLLNMPTYVILPRYPGSRLKQKGDILPIQESYGYIEYLDHGPEGPTYPESISHHVYQNYHSSSPEERLQWDWITDQPEEVRTAYRIWGRIIAFAVVFLQTDLHISNQRFHKRKPHIIDLENSLVKPIETPDQTLILQFFNKTTQALNQMNTAEFFRPWMVNDAPHDAWIPLIEVPVRMASLWPEPLVYSVNQLYLVEENSARAASLNIFDTNKYDMSLRMDLIKGIGESMKLMKDNLNALKTWRDEVRLKEVVVRDVLRPTDSFLGHISTLKRRVIEFKDNTITDRDRIIDALIQGYQTKAQQEGLSNKNAYKLETPEWNGVDYANLDVPSHYRRVGSTDLIASTGKLYKDFYATTGMKLLDQSFAQKLPSDSEAFGEQLLRITQFARPPLPAPLSDRPDTRRRRNRHA